MAIGTEGRGPIQNAGRLMRSLFFNFFHHRKWILKNAAAAAAAGPSGPTWQLIIPRVNTIGGGLWWLLSELLTGC